MLLSIRDYDHWRSVSRVLLQDDVAPSQVRLQEQSDQPLLFPAESVGSARPTGDRAPADGPANRGFTVPREFIALGKNVGYHRDRARWDLLYRILWRLTNELPHLLELSTDDDVLQLRTMEKQVRRDAHKMKAFVRFRKVVRSDVEYFIAWHRPDHYVLRKVAPFFSRRFKAMNWAILTPDESVTWDQDRLRYAPGVPRSAAPAADELEDLWKTYYASIYNPARVKVQAMKNEMPVRYWPTMPETELIPDLLKSAEGRVDQMLETAEGYSATAADFIARHERENSPISTLAELGHLASACTACDLHCGATQTVFGEGPATARLVIVGEQPGDREDRTGRPFVGPAGEVLDEVLASAGVPRQEVYLTNVVKHFKYTTSGEMHPRQLRGKKRLHKRPSVSEVEVCKPWLWAEWKLLRSARVLVCLGSTAAKALIAPYFKVSTDRGKFFRSELCNRTIATWHPSAVLRMPDASARAAKQFQMVADLTLALSSIPG